MQKIPRVLKVDGSAGGDAVAMGTETLSSRVTLNLHNGGELSSEFRAPKNVVVRASHVTSPEVKLAAYKLSVG